MEAPTLFGLPKEFITAFLIASVGSNISETGEYVINLLQCRPLQVAQDREEIAVPERPDRKFLY